MRGRRAKSDAVLEHALATGRNYFPVLKAALLVWKFLAYNVRACRAPQVGTLAGDSRLATVWNQLFVYDGDSAVAVTQGAAKGKN